jgi:hypothetical protein
MLVFSFEYVVPKVLVSLCTKFDKNPRRKTSFVDILLSGSVLTGHIRPLTRHIRTRPDISSPSTHPNNLAKRQRPSSLREESSPEDSPPCGGTPNSPEEFECLKIRAPDCHINQEEVDYNKEDLMNIITLWDRSCYNHGKERGTD